jgi:hypothetical protein
MATQAYRSGPSVGVGAHAMTEQADENPEIASARSAGARRMARYRARRREGLRCLRILLRESEVDVLIRRGRLSKEERANPAAIRKAVHELLDEYLQ